MLSREYVIIGYGHEILICGNIILTFGNVILCRGHEISFYCGNDILMLWPRDVMFREKHPFLVPVYCINKPT